MDAGQFSRKWRQVALTERAAAQQHFLDLCELLGHPKPAEADPEGSWFAFEYGARKQSGGEGWADVWKKGFFAFEYKGRKKNLEAAYNQLLNYREALENPPLLVVCDLDRIVIHTNFTATAKKIYDFNLDSLTEPDNLEVLRQLFHEPEKLRPGATSVSITQEAAARIGEVAQAMRDRGLEPLAVAQFLDRVVFCLFAEDIGLLPDKVMTALIRNTRFEPKRFARQCHLLFIEMARGGDFGAAEIPQFNGNLFSEASVIELLPNEMGTLHAAAKLDWEAVDPAIFGTLFERGLDPAQRSQLGAHYTSREDIVTLLEPVMMAPLRRAWDELREQVRNLLSTGEAQPSEAQRAAIALKPLGPRQLQKAKHEAGTLIHRFLTHLAEIKVLDPACGSGNFLFVALQLVKDLEKQAVLYAMDQDLGSFLPLVGPWQFHGIELNPYAFELAQMSIWIGYLQWTRHNGYGIEQNPILRPLTGNYQCRDAILAEDEQGQPRPPEWPKVDYIVGNPPFLGGKLLRRELGDAYLERLHRCWQGRVPPEADLCCYWFEQARAAIASGQCLRAGLLATQGIRGGANRAVLARIKESGGIFFAMSDRPWVLAGANVHISMVGFDNGTETQRQLDGQPVATINANLSSRDADLTKVGLLSENAHLSFMGTTKQGSFEVPPATAREWLLAPNPQGRPNSDILTPWCNGRDLASRPRGYWLIDTDRLPFEQVVGYELPFRQIDEQVRKFREQNPRPWYKAEWWRLYADRPHMRQAIQDLPRFLVTPTVAKHRLFTWLKHPYNPDHQLIVFGRADDYFMGVLQSRFHERWALALGTQVRERETGFRYTPTTCFETFPLPWLPGQEPSTEPRYLAIAAAARHLDELRQRWLNPPEWTREEILEFPASSTGPWAKWVQNPDRHGVGLARWPQLLPLDAACASKLRLRHLTALYNLRPAWLAAAHRQLDEAVGAAYGLSPDLPEGDLLAALLERNQASAFPLPGDLPSAGQPPMPPA